MLSLFGRWLDPLTTTRCEAGKEHGSVHMKNS